MYPRFRIPTIYTKYTNILEIETDIVLQYFCMYMPSKSQALSNDNCYRARVPQGRDRSTLADCIVMVFYFYLRIYGMMIGFVVLL